MDLRLQQPNLEEQEGGVPAPEEQSGAATTEEGASALAGAGGGDANMTGPGGDANTTDAGGDDAPLPPLPPPPPSNTPLAVQGSFARPGSAAANPFMTDTVMRDKSRGGVREREMRFGTGSASSGAPPMDEDLIAALRARGKGGVR